MKKTNLSKQLEDTEIPKNAMELIDRISENEIEGMLLEKEEMGDIVKERELNI